MTGELAEQTCTTPCEMKLSRKKTFMANVPKEGFSSIAAKLTPHVSTGGGTAMAGNLLIGGVVAAVVDGSPGAMNDLLPNPCESSIKPNQEHHMNS